MTCPSPARTTLPLRRMDRTVVERIRRFVDMSAILDYSSGGDDSPEARVGGTIRTSPGNVAGFFWRLFSLAFSISDFTNSTLGTSERIKLTVCAIGLKNSGPMAKLFLDESRGRRPLVQFRRKEAPPLPTPESFHAAIIKFLDSAETAKRIACCPACQSPVEYQVSWLIFEGRSWNMALPICPMCDAKPHCA